MCEKTSCVSIVTPHSNDQAKLLVRSFLMTDQPGTARQLYGRRMTVEQFFQDGKCKRNGWSLRDAKITKPKRFDRLLLILAIAYLLLSGLGLIAKRQFRHSAWCSTNRDA